MNNARTHRYFSSNSHHPRGIHTFSETLVAKSIGWPEDPLDEVHAMDQARALGVNVPVVHRIVPDEINTWIIMDRVHGETVQQLWPRIGLWTTTTGGLHSRRMSTQWLDGIYGPIPHASPIEFAGYLHW
ncbi:hypothetical protein K474DRAFT_1088988 [Panus rudis PR-1116 ss-1]|nr:hypothetical protein K474DRAFT_1088988 [Panus rudis PR-1116 ss-1]